MLILFATLQSHPTARRHYNKIKTVVSLETCLAKKKYETASRNAKPPMSSLPMSSPPTHSSRDKSPAGSPITALTAVSLRGLPLRLHHPSHHRGFVFRPAYSWRKYHKYRRTATSPSGYFCVPFSTLLFSRRLVFLFSSLVIPLQAARMSKRVVRKGWRTTLSVASRRNEKET